MKKSSVEEKTQRSPTDPPLIALRVYLRGLLDMQMHVQAHYKNEQ